MLAAAADRTSSTSARVVSLPSSCSMGTTCCRTRAGLGWLSGNGEGMAAIGAYIGATSPQSDTVDAEEHTVLARAGWAAAARCLGSLSLQ